jgi:nucleoside 2-deoxyribosyltransferase
VRDAGLCPLDPWDDSVPEAHAMAGAVDAAAADVVAAVRALTTRNVRLLDAARGVLAVLDGPDVDSGTAAEIGYAAALRLPIVGIRMDSRRTGEAGAVVNAQVQHFINNSGGELLTCPVAYYRSPQQFLSAAAARLAAAVGSGASAKD